MLLIIGLDGADWDILNPWLEGGELPHLAALRARGRHGLLRSTIRPESSTAWSSFATGVNPGKHGIFGFSGQQPHSYQIQLNNAASIRRPSFWQHAAAQGKRIALLNVPMTYPPQPFAHGALVAGMLSPSTRSPFTHPPELRPKLLAAIPDYSINVEQTGLNLRQFIRQTTRAIVARGRAALWLLQQDAWDAAAFIFTATDRLQHHTLHLLYPGHPQHDPAQAAALLPDLLAAYQAIDSAVGELVAAAGPDATTILLSDHGFAPSARIFYPNTWLEQKGLLKRHSRISAKPGLWQRLRANPSLRRLKNSLPLLKNWQRPPTPGGTLHAIDWTSTQVVFSPSGGLRLNLRGREPQGILTPAQGNALLDQLSKELFELTDPAHGGRPVHAPYRREQLYDGPHVARSPDLIIEPRRSDPDPSRNTMLAYDFGAQPFASGGAFTGNHTLDGILLVAGPDIVPGSIADARLIDLAPTILHALDLPLPPDLDGKPLPLWQHMAPIRTADSSTLQSPAPAAPLDAADEAAVAERLRSLGYL